MAKERTKNRTTQVVQLYSRQHYGGASFPAATDCATCHGNARYGLKDPPADEYELTLSEEAGRIVKHAQRDIWDGDPEDAAGMLRDAARLLDLWGHRQRARREAERKASHRSRKAARS